MFLPIPPYIGLKVRDVPLEGSGYVRRYFTLVDACERHGVNCDVYDSRIIDSWHQDMVPVRVKKEGNS